MTGLEKPVILVTGIPGIGKTTLVRRWAEKAGDCAGGFYTQEIREGGRRAGFEIVTFDGRKTYLAKKSPERCFRQEVRFKSYRVNLSGIEEVAAASLVRAREKGRIIFVDEIGPMECISEVFRRTISELLDDPNVLMIGTIVKRSHPFADEVKRRPKVKLIEVTAGNRRRLVNEWDKILESWKDD
jgi:nucleoside-triphosphatase